MDLQFTPEEEAFRLKVRDWLAENMPTSGLSADREGRDDKTWLAKAKAWQRRLYEAGYVALAWPKEYGGQAMDPVRQSIVNDEMVRAKAPYLVGGSGLGMLGPTLISWGSEEQKQRYLPKILTAEEIWCQGYSEPGAGSDLASLKTRAEIVGDEFVVNGQKVWTSGAQYADMMFCLVRTDPEAPKHRGISYILIDMHTPGITVRPLVQMTGDRGFNEVFFDNVRVPRKNLVAKLNEGWIVANATLFHERNMLGSASGSEQRFNRLLALAKSITRGGRPLTEDPVFRQRLVESGDPRRGDALSLVAPAHRSDSRQESRRRGDDQQARRHRAESRPRHRRDGGDGRLLDALARRRSRTRSRLLAVRMDVLARAGDRRRHLAHPEKHNRRARPQNAQVPVRRGRSITFI